MTDDLRLLTNPSYETDMVLALGIFRKICGPLRGARDLSTVYSDRPQSMECLTNLESDPKAMAI